MTGVFGSIEKREKLARYGDFPIPFSIDGRIVVPTPPQFLYKYAPDNLEWIGDVLLNKRVYFSSPLRFNDPLDSRITLASDPESLKAWFKLFDENLEFFRKLGFEQLPENEQKEHCGKLLSDSEYREESLHEAAKELCRNIAVCCFAESPEDMAMWGHYANSSKGVCYKFNLSAHWKRTLSPSALACFPFDFVEPVRYSAERIVLHPKDLQNIMVAVTKDAHLTKSLEWKNEKEWRIIALSEFALMFFPPEQRRAFASLYRGEGLYPLDKGLLSGVILGCEMDAPDKREVVAMANKGGVKIYQARTQQDAYGLKIEPYRG